MQREKEEKKGSSTLVCKETWMYKMCVNHHNLLTMVFLFWDFFSQKTQNAKEGKGGGATQQKPKQHFSILMLLMMIVMMIMVMMVMVMITLSHRWTVFSVSKQPKGYSITRMQGSHISTHGSQGTEGGGLQPITNYRIKHVRTPIILYK
jgi:hypothetical protein